MRNTIYRHKFKCGPEIKITWLGDRVTLLDLAMMALVAYMIFARIGGK